jgi:hypothetical protein
MFFKKEIERKLLNHHLLESYIKIPVQKMEPLIDYKDPQYWDVMDLASSIIAFNTPESANVNLDKDLQDLVTSYHSVRCKAFLIKYAMYYKEAQKVKGNMNTKYEELFFCLNFHYLLGRISNQKYEYYRDNICKNYYHEYYTSPELQSQWKDILNVFDN